MNRIVGWTLAAALTAGTACATTTNALGRDGITWTFARPRPVGQYVNGDWWVVGPVTITAISPTPEAGRHGTMINPAVGTAQGFDKDFTPDYNPYDPALNVGTNLPLTVAPDSSVVSSMTAGDYTKHATVQMLAILTVVKQPPPAGSFRPPALGMGSRNSLWCESQIDYARLNNLPRAPLTEAPPITDCVAPFTHPWLELNPNWTGGFLRPPYMAENGYGREIAHRTGTAALLLNLDYTPAEKRDLLMGVVQVGIDNYGFIANGGVWYNDGGHNLGRLSPLIIAAGVLNDPRLLAVIKGPEMKFQEFQNTFFVTQADVDRVRGTWNHERNALAGTNGDPIHPYTAKDIGMAEWGIRHSGTPELDNNWILASYREINGATFTAPTLTARVMGLRLAIDWEPLFQYAERHLNYEQGPDYKGEWAANSTPAFHKQFYNAYKDATLPAR